MYDNVYEFLVPINKIFDKEEIYLKIIKENVPKAFSNLDFGNI